MLPKIGTRVIILALACLLPNAPAVAAEPETVAIDARAAGRPFPHFWESVFGSGRANLALRESYRRDLDAVRAITSIQYVRFHAIFHDETGSFMHAKDADGLLPIVFFFFSQSTRLVTGCSPISGFGS